jgi:hypothetical protein
VRSEDQLGPRQRGHEACSKGFVRFVDASDVVEAGTRSEGVVTLVRRGLEVPCPTGQAVVVVGREERPAFCLVGDDQAARSEQVRLLFEGEVRLHDVFQNEKGPSHVSIVERLGRGSIASILARRP